MKSSPEVIVAESLTRTFAGKPAVDSLSFEVAAGEVFGLLGHNGAGKTTTVRLLCGVLDPSSGSARVFGLDPALEGSEVRRRAGVSTETPSLDERLTGRQSLAFFAELYGVPKEGLAGRIDGLLGQFDLEAAADQKVGAYSKGMKQRLALARALLHDPELLCLDEPTSGLDPVATRAVTDMIGRLSRDAGKTVLLCTHNLAQAQALCDRVAILEHGRLVAAGTPGELAERSGQRHKLHVELAPESVETALSALRGQQAAGAPVRQHNMLSLPVESREAVPEVVARLVAAGARIYEVRLEQPSLEDVYFALHQESVAESAA